MYLQNNTLGSNRILVRSTSKYVVMPNLNCPNTDANTKYKLRYSLNKRYTNAYYKSVKF